jgi:hypothetical protein
VSIVGERPESGVRIEVERPHRGGPPWSYQGEAITSGARIRLLAVVDAGGGVTVEFPSGEFRSGEFRSDEFPSGEFPSGEFPSGEFPSGEFPSGEFPSGEFPSDEAPAVPAPGESATGNRSGSKLFAEGVPGTDETCSFSGEGPRKTTRHVSARHLRADLADRVRLILRAAWRHAKEDGVPPPRRIVRWRPEA